MTNNGGADEDRTRDPLVANQVLSQLSYSPFSIRKLKLQKPAAHRNHQWKLKLEILDLKMVGLGRLELPTSRLSGVRSSHLSYRPLVGATCQVSETLNF